ncbi:MAG: amino acid adenylation domain-containing protein, partial [Simkaniaceae bacterium]|nr:amino acid adenylation domain-containing protein [Simkaniaceae bacterium]
MTDIQRAYLLGRTDAFSLGGIYSHIYSENEIEHLDIERLEQALNHLIARHDMLRAVILEDGTQHVLEKVPYYHIKLNHNDYLCVRKSMTKTARDHGQWPLFEVQCTQLNTSKTVVHFYFDLLIADGTGLEVIFDELSSYYRRQSFFQPELTVQYRDCILALDKETEALKRAKAYWFQRIDQLPEAPELPTATFQDDNTPEFVRRFGRLEPNEWKSFQKRASSMGITVAALLMTLYGEVLKTWSKSPHFTLNVMFFNRPPLHPDIDRIVANFSTTLLLEMNLSGQRTLEEKAHCIQEQLLKDLEHSSFNGIKVLNELNRRRNGSKAAAMPVVFACALNLRPPQEEREPSLFKWYGRGVSYNQLETPQVWVDHQVFEDDDGSLSFYWDVRDGYFPEGMIGAMFETYQTLLKTVAHCASIPESLVPKRDLEIVEKANATGSHPVEDYLHIDFFQCAQSRPQNIALITSNETISYGELAHTALFLSKQLKELAIQPNQCIAIIMDKGWEQVAAALAIHACGAAYIPIDAALPQQRIEQILSISQCKGAVIQKGFQLNLSVRTFLLENVVMGSDFAIPTPIQQPNDLAYVIFTSGSTGIPKGVMIEHRAAKNTIKSMGSKYQISEKDRSIALASLSFDLSVFDIFAPLSYGGSLFIPTDDEVKNPSAWIDAIGNHQITIWNSAPALMQVLIDYLELSPLCNESLRLILMSGDWIPTALPHRISRFFKAQVISLGGATEASIWSNDYPIETVDPSWVSIPYGKPLPNQQMMVLDENLKPKPLFTPGMIYIGGEGLARGYLGDDQKTKEAFVFDPKSGKRLYRTGDLGRLHPDGNIEFLGREDLQVKVQGYRIELEEIEAAIASLDPIDGVVVRITGDKNEAKRIVAFYKSEQKIDVEWMKSHVETTLPFYMTPSLFVQLDHFPLTSNGKIDTKTLLAQLRVQDQSEVYEEPVGSMEIKMANIWKDLLHIEKVSRNDNFFSLGGTSFLAFQMIHQCQKQLGLSIPLSLLFKKGSIRGLLENEKKNEDTSFVVLKEEGDKSPLFLVHPSGGGALCYTEFAEHLNYKGPIYAFQSPGYMESRPFLPTVKEMAEHYLSLIRKAQKTGPYRLGGWSFGGVVAYEMALQLQKMGESLLPLIMIDSPAPIKRNIPNAATLQTWFLEEYQGILDQMEVEAKDNLFAVFKNNISALINYQPKTSELPIVLMRATQIKSSHLKEHPHCYEDHWGWNLITRGNIAIHSFDTDHSSILQNACLHQIADICKKVL